MGHLYFGDAVPDGPAMVPLNPGPDKTRCVRLYGSGHVFNCDFTYKDGNSQTTPSVGNLTSPVGPIVNLISLSMSQYMNSPNYNYDVSFTGAIPPWPALPAPGSPMKVKLYKESRWYIAATADVVCV